MIAIYENKEDLTDLSKGSVMLQTMTDAKNIVTVPIKHNSRQVLLEDLKANLLKHLPNIVYVDNHGAVALSSNERQRIGRVLPHGQG